MLVTWRSSLGLYARARILRTLRTVNLPNMMKKILITGALGFLGSQLCDRFVNQGYDVIGIDTDANNLFHVKHLLSHKNFRLIRQEMTGPLTLEGKLDYILYVVPLTGTKCALTSHYLLQLAQVKNARMLITSTAEVEDDLAGNPQSEAYWGKVNPAGPFGVYEEAKRFWATMTNAYRAFSNVESPIKYVFKTYSPTMRFDNGLELPAFIATHCVATNL